MRRCLLSVCSIVALCAMPAVLWAAAAEQPALALLRPDSLLGWDHGPAPRGWKIADGKLTGSAEANELLSGFTLGDFELDWQWTVEKGARWKIGLPQAPAGPAIEIILAESADCGRIAQEKKQLAAGKAVAAQPSGKHTAKLSRAGGKLHLAVDGQPISEAIVSPAQRYGLTLSVEKGSASLEQLTLKEPVGEAIFNGQDLTGWWCPGNIKAWGIKDGEMVKAGDNGNYIRTERLYGNFTLSLEYMINEGGNSGVGIRTPRDGWPSGDGMELQFYDHAGLDKHSTMSIYGNVEPVARADKSEQWNHVVVKADGRMITGWINGQLVQHANTGKYPELKHRNLAGWIGLQDHGGWSRFRNIRVLEAPAEDAGLKAWDATHQPTGVELVLDRVLNPERLSVADGLGSGVVAATAGDSSETVLADLKGPGALVQIQRSDERGRLAFYFDGEAKPRIDCTAEQLRGLLPAIGEDDRPLLTCVPYRQSLKVVLRDAPKTSYRLEYVTFPASVQVDSFTSTAASIPRGWLSSINYRYHQQIHGTQRQFEPMPRVTIENQKLDPGASVPLVKLSGAGMVHWIKLLGGPKPLTDDLWLDVTVDGESGPAISAPARYLLAAIQDGVNHSGFVMMERDGRMSRLAMPYGKGLSIVARNTGKEPLTGIGLTVSNEAATAEAAAQFAGRMRLRSFYRPGKPSTAGPIELRGPGRLVGLVSDITPQSDFAVASLAIDGKPRSEWNGLAGRVLIGSLPNEAELRRSLGGRAGGLAWRYWLLAPPQFERSLSLASSDPNKGELVLYYQGQQ